MSDETLRRGRRVAMASIGGWLGEGWELYRRSLVGSSLFAAIFALIGAAGLYGVVHFAVTPMAYPWASAFLLVGPSLLCGYLHAAQRLRAGEAVGVSVFFVGFLRASAPIWAVAFLSGFLVLIWITDAAVVYGLYFGTEPVMLDWALFSRPMLDENLIPFLIGSSVGGVILAMIVLAIGAFSVPLIFFRRLGLVNAVGMSVRAVWNNLAVMTVWGALLAGSIIAVVLVFIPAFIVLFPVLAFASERAYRDVWGEDE